MAQAVETNTPNAEQDEEKKVDNSNGDDLLCLGVHSTKDDRVKISVIPPILEKGKRLPVIMSCVVDTSGSMGCDAIIKDENGKEESHGLSILDLVKHSIKTIIECLGKRDYLSIISYSDKAKVITNLIAMNKKNKKKTLNALKKLQADGQTNLWDGLFNGLEQLRKCKEIECKNNNAALLLFTDGLPNINPPKGHIAMLDKYIETNKGLDGMINTYGFGYSLDTKLLNQLAIKGNGNYSFIPDSSFVGTIFVNSISNICSNVARDVTLRIATNMKKYDPVIVGGYSHLLTPKGIQINLGTVAYGQNKDIVIKFIPKEQNHDNDDNDDNTMDVEGDEGDNKDNDEEKLVDINTKSLSYVSLRNNSYIDAASDVFDDDKGNNKLTEMNYYRLLSCDVLRDCMDSMKIHDMDEAQQKLRDLIRRIKTNKLINKEKYIVDLLEDLKGQAFEAISKKEYYDKWGKHYLPSLIFAHLHQYNNNFKDPGVQNYGGKLFNLLRDKANDIFIKMAAPKPSYVAPVWLKEFEDGSGAAPSSVAAKNVDMSAYMNHSGGCFDGNCTVKMYDNSLKLIKDLNAGDMVINGAVVKCVIKYKCNDNKTVLSTLNNYNGLKITPYHPIKIKNEWVFPLDVDNGNHREEECDFVYNFVLSDHHILIVNGIECCSLAHNFVENDVIKHEYFGTNKIIHDLRKFNGWKNGQINLNHDAFQRDPNSNLIYKIMQN